MPVLGVEEGVDWQLRGLAVDCGQLEQRGLADVGNWSWECFKALQLL